jgi:hypothetical protein
MLHQRRCLLIALMVAAVCAAAPASAMALDPGDSISLTSVAPTTGQTIYAGYEFAFGGSGTVDGPDPDFSNYTESVLLTPASSPVFAAGCPSDYNVATDAIDMAYGQDSLAEYESDWGQDDLPLTGDGPSSYTWAAAVNDGVAPTVTNPGNYVACAYLIDETVQPSPTDDTFAVSTPVAFTVQVPPGSKPPGQFGGTPGKTGTPSNLGLTVKPAHSPIRAPGHNLLEISGRYDPTSGGAGLVVTLKSTRRYNGCAANDEQDTQVTAADGGVILTIFESVSANAAGAFKSPFALNFKKKLSGTYVICAYLTQGDDDLLVGFDRFVAKGKPKPKPKPRPRPKPQPRHSQRHDGQ